MQALMSKAYRRLDGPPLPNSQRMRILFYLFFYHHADEYFCTYQNASFVINIAYCNFINVSGYYAFNESKYINLLFFYYYCGLLLSLLVLFLLLLLLLILLLLELFRVLHLYLKCKQLQLPKDTTFALFPVPGLIIHTVASFRFLCYSLANI